MSGTRCALHLATRFAGTDGVSLEAEKVAAALAHRGYDPVWCAGEVADDLPGARVVLPELHFTHPDARALAARAFPGEDDADADGADRALRADLEAAAGRLGGMLRDVVADVDPSVLVVQNAWAIPMHLALAGALARVVEATGLPVLSHEHDYHWERERFAGCRVPEWLAAHFPHSGPNVRHLAINSPAAAALRRHRGLAATVLPNVWDFDADHRGDGAAFRAAAGLSAHDRVFLQPTRVVRRKGIELSVELLARRGDPADVVVITHAAGDEGEAYLAELRAAARSAGVRLLYVPDLVAPRPPTGARRNGARQNGARPSGAKRLWLADAYAAADFVTYPSRYEGFGNALVEAVAFRRPALVNRYAVYDADIRPLGFDFVEIDGTLTPAAVAAVQRLLDDPDERRRIVEHNHTLGRRHLSTAVLRRIVDGELRALGVPLPA